MSLFQTGRSFNRGQRPQGFTLVELLVASAITLVIAGMLLTLVVNLLDGWNRTQGRLTAEGQAQRVFDQLAQDLHGATYRDDGQTWLAATVQPETGASGVWLAGTKPSAASLDPAAEALANARFGVAGVWLRLFTTRQGADPRTGDPATTVAVAYQLIRRPPTAAGSACAYLFYRAEVSPGETFTTGDDITAPAYLTPAETEGAAGNIARPALAQVMANNVIDFGVRFYGGASDPMTPGRSLALLWPKSPGDVEYRVTGSPAEQRPAVADVMVRILTEEGTRRIAALEAGQIPGDWWAVAAAHSRVFTRRILLRVDSF